MKKYILFICLGISIFLNLVLTVVLFTRSPGVSQPIVAETMKPSEDKLAFKNSFGSLSTITKMDFNNDGVDELIFWPRSASWYTTVSILNDELKPFCKNCEFAVYGNGINFEDLSQEKEGLIEVRVGDLDNSGEGYDPSHTIESATYTLQNGDFVVMPADTPATVSAQYQPQELTPEQRADYLATYKDPFVLYLRTALDGYLAGKGSEVGVDAFTIEKNISDTMTSGLAAFDQDYYRSKFIVYAVNPAPFGGKEVSIIFRDKPDKMFTAWIYQTGENSFTLNGFWQPSSITDEKMAILRVMLKPLLEDEANSM